MGVAKWLRPRIVVPVFVGSNPITHPRKRKGDLLGLLSFFARVVMGIERLNATRTSVAADGLTEANLYFRLSENANESLTHP